jgi:prepilin-type N-terminal cleavage/methylation domain-containing protein
MTIITLLPTRPHRRRNVSGPRHGFTLVELMIAVGLSGFILAGVLSSFLFLGRSGANIRNYSDMEAQARKALELFAEDTRQASDATWASATSVTLNVDGINVVYSYNAGTFTRTSTSGSTTLLTGIQAPTRTNPFFRAYSITGDEITDFSTAAARSAARNATKQIQISLSAARRTQTVTAATNIVLSARYVLRNKRVTA